MDLQGDESPLFLLSSSTCSLVLAKESSSDVTFISEFNLESSAY